MTGTLIVSTPKSSMHALAFQGIIASTCYAQIRDMLINKFGDEYMLLFARPAENTANGEIDWYTPVQGPVQKLVDLPLEEQEPIEQTLSHMAGEILRYAEELIRAGEHLKVTRGNILRLALSYPDKNCLYVVGKQPVFTCWGFGPGTPGVEPENLWRLASVAAVRPPAAPLEQLEKPVEKEPDEKKAVAPFVWSWAWLWWLLPLLLILLLLCLLFGGFGNIPALSGNRLFSVPGSEFMSVDDSDKKAELENEIENLKSRLRSHIAMCVPKNTSPPVAVVPQKPVAEPEMPRLVIPENAEDTSFMEGQWLCETGLANMRTKEPVKVHIRFGRDGRGEATTYEKNDKCVGPAQASIKDDILHIELGRARCQNARSNYYDRVSIDCINRAGSQAECHGINADGSKWDAEFIRIE